MIRRRELETTGGQIDVSLVRVSSRIKKIKKHDRKSLAEDPQPLDVGINCLYSTTEYIELLGD